jgi:hypothetical protein
MKTAAREVDTRAVTVGQTARTHVCATAGATHLLFGTGRPALAAVVVGAQYVDAHVAAELFPRGAGLDFSAIEATTVGGGTGVSGRTRIEAGTGVNA